MVEKNCSDAARNSGEMLGSRNGRYPMDRGEKKALKSPNLPPSHLVPEALPSSHPFTCILRGHFLQKAGQPFIQDNVLKIKRGKERPALELRGWEEGLGGR